MNHAFLTRLIFSLKFKNERIDYFLKTVELTSVVWYETGNKEGATRDWQRIATLGHSFNSEYRGNLTGLNGFEEFANVLSK